MQSAPPNIPSHAQISPLSPESSFPPFDAQRYILEKQLGQGGDGQVFKARDVKLLRDVAIKIIANVEGFALNEAQLLAKIDHPNIIKIYDVNYNKRYIALITELVDADFTPTSNAIKQMAPDTFFQFYTQLLHAVDHLHCNDLLHLDLKPENILINNKKQVKITDFGISRLCNTTGESEINVPKGSWYCLSPEQCKNQKLSTASDIFSLGVIWYEYTYGEHPFLVFNDVSMSRRNLLRGDPSPRPLPKPISHEQEQLLLRMLSQAPQRRPSIKTVLQFIKNQQASTEPLLTTCTIELPRPLTKKIWLWFLPCVIIAVIALTFAFSSKLKVKTTLVIPTLISSTPNDLNSIESQNNNLIVSQLVQDEIESLTLYDPNRTLVSNKEWSGSRDWTLEVEQADVDEIIISEVHCKEEYCEVQVGKFDRKSMMHTYIENRRIPYEDITLFTQMVKQLVVSELNFKTKDSSTLTSKLTAKDLTFYYNVKSKLANFDSPEDVLPQLSEFLLDKPDFIGGHILLGATYLSLHAKSEKIIWLNKCYDVITEIKRKFPNHPEVLKLEFDYHLKSRNLKLAQFTLMKMKGKRSLDLNRLLLSQALLEFQYNPKTGYESLSSIPTPRFTSSYYHHKAYMEQSLNAYESLETTSKAWLSRFPQNNMAQFYYAESFFLQGKLERAKAQYLKYQEHQGDYHSLINIALCDIFLGDYESSIHFLNKAMIISPSADVYLNIAEATKAIDPSKSEHYFIQALQKYQKIESPSSLQLAYQALVLAHLKRNDEALTTLQLSAQSPKQDESFFLIAAYTYSLLGNPETAFFNAKEAQKRGFRAHYFNLPWTQLLYTKLK